ncbi:hypothetical protein EDB86DRAFT_1849749 [Lactarius hatsudake]|nr:hypothetical protein EDB86DRAFT_1849749 [Lactarius hatsudake]
MCSVVRVSNGESSDTMDWDYSETSNFATKAMFGSCSWLVIDQVPDMELVTVAMHPVSVQFESLGDIPSDTLPPVLCRLCDRRFSRQQELRRHISQVHSPPRQCLFCRYQWKRPHKIKDHLLKVHCNELSPETLKGISALNGRGLVEFLDTPEHLPHNVIPLASGSSTPLSKSLPTNIQNPGTDSDITVHPAGLKSLDIADRAPPCDVDFVRDDDLERILRTGDRTGVMSSLGWPTNDKSLRTSTEHQNVAMPSLGLKNLAGTASDVDHPCQACGVRFRRPQELRRHISQVHSPPRQCLFCRYQWKRPHKIKDHLLKVHCNELSPETLKGISALNGRGLVEFLDTSKHLPHDVIPLAGGSSTPLSKSREYSPVL